MPRHLIAELTDKQKKAVENLMSGNFATTGKALQDAGYNKRLKFNRFIKKRGVQLFLKHLDDNSFKLYGTTITDKIMQVYTDALGAEKVVGRLDQVVPDHKIRLDVADKITQIMGIKPVEAPQAPVNQTNIQYNYFSTDKSKQKDFNAKFLGFVSDFREDDSDPHARATESSKESQDIEEVEEA